MRRFLDFPKPSSKMTLLTPLLTALCAATASDACPLPERPALSVWSCELQSAVSIDARLEPVERRVVSTDDAATIRAYRRTLLADADEVCETYGPGGLERLLDRVAMRFGVAWRISPELKSKAAAELRRALPLATWELCETVALREAEGERPEYWHALLLRPVPAAPQRTKLLVLAVTTWNGAPRWP